MFPHLLFTLLASFILLLSEASLVLLIFFFFLKLSHFYPIPTTSCNLSTACTVPLSSSCSLHLRSFFFLIFYLPYSPDSGKSRRTEYLWQARQLPSRLIKDHTHLMASRLHTSSVCSLRHLPGSPGEELRWNRWGEVRYLISYTKQTQSIHKTTLRPDLFISRQLQNKKQLPKSEVSRSL